MDRKELIDKMAEEWKLQAADNTGMNDLEFFNFIGHCFNDILVKEWDENHGI